MLIVLLELNDVVLGSPPLTDDVLAYNGTNWVNQASSPSNNWISANIGENFTVEPATLSDGAIAIGEAASIGSFSLRAIAIGDGASVGNQGDGSIAVGENANTGYFDRDAISIGTGATAAGSNSISIGLGAATKSGISIGTNATGNGASSGDDIAIGTNASGTHARNIAIGRDATATFPESIAIGAYAATTRADAIAIGSNTTAGPAAGTNGHSHIAIGNGAKAQAGAYSTYSVLAIGHAATSYKSYQVVIGPSLTASGITDAGGIDVGHSVKIGSGIAGDINILHLHSKGKLELVGDEAQFVMPDYAVGSPATYPANAVEGGVIYDSVAKGLIVYGGSPAGWSAVGSSSNWIDANNGENFTVAPSSGNAGNIAIGEAAETISTRIDAVAIGNTAVTQGNRSVAIGVDSYCQTNNDQIAIGNAAHTLSDDSIAIGTDTKSYGVASVAIGELASSQGAHSITIGHSSNGSGDNGITVGYSTTSFSRADVVAIGANSSTNSISTVLIGTGTSIDSSNDRSINIGAGSAVTQPDQVSVGAGLAAADVTSDVAYSSKIGYAGTSTADKNLLHLFSKGKLELYGDEAQFIFPNYAVGSPATYPANSIEGGVIYDSVAKGLIVYGGSPAGWSAVGGGDVVEDTTPQLGGDLDTNGYSIITPTAGANDTGTNITITPGQGDYGYSGGNVIINGGYGGGDVSLLGGGYGNGSTDGGTILIKSGQSSGGGDTVTIQNDGASAKLVFNSAATIDVFGTLNSTTTDGAAAEAFVMDTTNAFTTSGASLLTLKTNAVEKVSFECNPDTNDYYKLRFHDTEATANNFFIGYSDSDTNYAGMFNDHGDFWLGVSGTGDTTYVNYYNGSTIDFGRTANRQEFNAYTNDTDTTGVVIDGKLKTKSISEQGVTILTTGAVTINLYSGTYFYNAATTGVITFTFSNPATSGNISSFTLELFGGGTNAPVWPASVKWPGGTEPTWSTGIDVVSFVTRNAGTTWLGMLGGTAFA